MNPLCQHNSIPRILIEDLIRMLMNYFSIKLAHVFLNGSIPDH